MAQNLEAQFDEAMHDIYLRAQRETGYKASRFFEMLQQHRGLRTAQMLLANDAVTEGYTALWERQRLDLTVEALVLTSPWRSLFTEIELQRAAKRLTEYGFDVNALLDSGAIEEPNLSTYLLAWNPNKWPWEDLPDLVARIAAGESVGRRWSCGSTTRIEAGDRIFLIRLGQSPRGIIGNGVVTKGVYEAPHWNSNSGGLAKYVDVQFDALVDPEENEQAMLSREVLKRDPRFSNMHWDIQSSGVQIKSKVAIELEKAWRDTQKSEPHHDPQTSNLSLVLGAHYTRREIFHIVGGGSLQSYLPFKDNQILCGCFDALLNPRSPQEISVGKSPVTLKSAQALASQNGEIPVFLKQETNAWVYIGQFKCTGFSQAKNDLDGHREDAVGVLYLEERLADEMNVPNDVFPQDLGASEGKRILSKHYRRERSPQLAKAKKRLELTKNGEYICEACQLNASTLPNDLAEGCFEVHHLVPIAELEDVSNTRLDDLALLCANCHRMIHRTSPLMSLEQFRNLLQVSRK